MKKKSDGNKLTTLITWILLPILVWQIAAFLYFSILYVSFNTSLAVEGTATGAIYDYDTSQLNDYSDAINALIDIQSAVSDDLTQAVVSIGIVVILLGIIRFKDRAFLKKLSLLAIGVAVFFLLIILTQTILRSYILEQAALYTT